MPAAIVHQRYQQINGVYEWVEGRMRRPDQWRGLI
jgi:hypothetical protein